MGWALGSPLLTPTTDEGINADPRPPSHVEGTHSLGAVDLVPADRQQVHLHLLNIHWYLPHSLENMRGIVGEV